MTCIVGLVADGTVWMGADSASIWSDHRREARTDPKLFQVGDMLIGYTSSFRMGQLLMYSLILPEHPDGETAHRYLATHFVDAVRATLQKGGFAKKEHEQEEGGTFLVGYRGGLYCVESDYQVGQAESGYTAAGCGSYFALGSLHSTRWGHPNDRINAALEAAAFHTGGVIPPFKVLNI